MIFKTFHKRNINLKFFVVEIRREKEFYESKGLPYPKDISNPNEPAELKSQSNTETPSKVDFHRYDEQVTIFMNKQSALT